MTSYIPTPYAGRRAPLRPWGPTGAVRLAERMRSAFEDDIRVRMADENVPEAATAIEARPSRTWGCYVPGRGMSAGGVMRWRVMLELAGADGARQVNEIGAGERPPAGHTAAALGLSLADGK